MKISVSEAYKTMLTGYPEVLTVQQTAKLLGCDDHTVYKMIYTGMLLKGNLKEHVETIDRDAQDLYETIVRNQAKQYGVNEELKARDQMEWVRWMNAIRLVAEEVVIKEVLQL